MQQRIYTLLLALLCCNATFAQTQKKNTVDEVIWVVGDQPILLSDIEGYRISAELSGQTFSNPYATIPEQLAIQKLYLHQAELDSVTISEGDLQRMVDFEMNRNIQRAGSRENLEALYRMPIAKIRELVKEQSRNGYLMEKVRDNLTSNIKVTPAEVREHFAQLPQDSIPLIPTQVEVQIITSRPKVSREEVERIEERLREFARRVNDGETDFARLARMYSQDLGSARMGGELGFNGRGQLVPEFANVAFSLNDPKKVSKIVRTEFGYHILQLIEKRNDKVNVRHILLKPEISQEEYERNLSRLDSIANDIRNNKFSFEEAARILSDDKDTRNNRGNMTYHNPNTRELSVRFEMKDLPQDIAKVVNQLNVGEVSKAFQMKDEKTGSDICAIVKLKNRIEEHRASMSDDFQVLRNLVLQERQQAAVQKWLVDKIKNTYTRISPDWRNQQFEYKGWVK